MDTRLSSPLASSPVAAGRRHARLLPLGTTMSFPPDSTFTRFHLHALYAGSPTMLQSPFSLWANQVLAGRWRRSAPD